MEIASYVRGIPTYRGLNGPIGLLCETKEKCITDEEGVSLDEKLETMQGQIEKIPDVTGFATETFVENAISGLASTEYVGQAISAASGGDAGTLNGNPDTYFATAESVTNIVNGVTKVGKAATADTATKATSADTATKATTADTAARATTADTATRASTADSATTATTATTATSAITATRATTADSATKATTADSATRATTADTATKATADGNGNNIVSTYLTKASIIRTATDPGVGATVSYADDTLIFVYK